MSIRSLAQRRPAPSSRTKFSWALGVEIPADAPPKEEETIVLAESLAFPIISSKGTTDEEYEQTPPIQDPSLPAWELINEGAKEEVGEVPPILLEGAADKLPAPDLKDESIPPFCDDSCTEESKPRFTFTLLLGKILVPCAAYPFHYHGIVEFLNDPNPPTPFHYPLFCHNPYFAVPFDHITVKVLVANFAMEHHDSAGLILNWIIGLLADNRHRLLSIDFVNTHSLHAWISIPRGSGMPFEALARNLTFRLHGRVLMDRMGVWIDRAPSTTRPTQFFDRLHALLRHGRGLTSDGSMSSDFRHKLAGGFPIAPLGFYLAET